jgi:hypothetical protein
MIAAMPTNTVPMPSSMTCGIVGSDTAQNGNNITKLSFSKKFDLLYHNKY